MCSRPRNPQRNPNPSASRGLRLPAERGVVQAELLERVAQVGIVVGLDREQAAEHHRLDLAVAGQRLARGSDLVVSVSPTRSLVTSLIPVIRNPTSPAWSAVAERHLRREEADVVDLGLGARLHRPDRLALRERPVDDPDVRDHAAVLVELGVEDQGARRLLGIAARGRDARDQLVEHVRHALAGLGADPADRVGGLSEQLGDLLGHPLGLGSGKVDLVQARDQLEARIDRQVRVGDGLRLDALARVDDQQRALARGERARHLVGEVDVAGRVDQMELIGLAVGSDS